MKAERAAARRRLLRRRIAEREVSSQQELVEFLARKGHAVTQATVSRDLAAIGAQKATGRGGEVYLPAASTASKEIAASRLRRMFSEFVTRVDHSTNLVVLHTAPGAAGPVASALDEEPPPGVIGTVAGDDTILVVTADGRGGSRLARWLERETVE